MEQIYTNIFNKVKVFKEVLETRLKIAYLIILNQGDLKPRTPRYESLKFRYIRAAHPDPTLPILSQENCFGELK